MFQPDRHGPALMFLALLFITATAGRGFMILWYYEKRRYG
jgi:hypothetical protein